MNKEVKELLDKLGSMEDAPLIWINEKVIENEKIIKKVYELRKVLNNEMLDMLPFDIAEQVQDLFNEILKGSEQ